MPFTANRVDDDSRFQPCILHTRVRIFAARPRAMFPMMAQESDPIHGTTSTKAKPAHRFPILPIRRDAVAPPLQFPRQNNASPPTEPCDLKSTSRAVPPAGHKESS